jgi:hypothetical protein
MRSSCCLCGCVRHGRQSVRLHVHISAILARQRLGKHVPAATNTHVKAKEFYEVYEVN